jgi:hypothetical protein
VPSSAVKLTKRVVDNAAPRTARYVIWDAEIKGFGLRVSERGTKTYILRYRPKGVGPAAPRRFVVLGRHGVLTPDQARAQARTVLGAVAGGKDPALTRKLHSTTVERACGPFHYSARQPQTEAVYVGGLCCSAEQVAIGRSERRRGPSGGRAGGTGILEEAMTSPTFFRLAATLEQLPSLRGQWGRFVRWPSLSEHPITVSRNTARTHGRGPAGIVFHRYFIDSLTTAKSANSAKILV